MKRILSILLAATLIIAMFASCSGGNTANTSSVSSTQSIAEPVREEVKLATLKGPTGMGMAYLLDASDRGVTKNNYKYDICAAPDEITAKIVSGEYNIAALPTNAAATLYNKSNGKIKMLALNTLGVLYIVAKGDTVKSIDDLRGKTIYASGQGATPEYVLKHILESANLKVGTDVKLDFTYSTHDDLVAFAAAGKADVVLLPEPNVTALLAKNSDMKVALDLNDLWAKYVAKGDNKNSVISMGCVVVNTQFLNMNPDVVMLFLQDYAESVSKVNYYKEDSAELIAKLGIVPAAGVALKALPRCKITFINDVQMKTQIENFYKTLYNANPASIGGKMPDDNFYFTTK